MSELIIRGDLVAEGLSVPVHFLDCHEDANIEHTETLNVDCIFSTDGEELSEKGYGIIVRITDPTQRDKYGEPWKDRMAFAYSIDFDWPHDKDVYRPEEVLDVQEGETA